MKLATIQKISTIGLSVSVLAFAGTLISCVKKVDANQNAFEIARGPTMSRVYAAFDPENPMQMSWYFCKDEPLDRNTSVTVNQVGPLPLGVRLAHALNGIGPLDSTGIANAGPGATTIEKVAVSRRIRLTERMTIRDFESPETGKGCKPIVANADTSALKESKAKIGQYFEKKVDIETTALMINALLACVGVTKEAFVTGSSFVQGLKGVPPEEFKSFLGFKTSKIDLKNNAGGLIWTFVTGLGYCSLSSRGLFNKVSDKFSLTDPNRAALFKFMDTVSVKAEDLLQVSQWSSKFDTDANEKLAYIRGEMTAEEERWKLAKNQLLIAAANSTVAVQATKEYAAIYNPLFVATWNAVETVSVEEESSAQGEFMDKVVKGLNGILAQISQSLSGAEKK